MSDGLQGPFREARVVLRAARKAKRVTQAEGLAEWLVGVLKIEP